MAQPLHKLYRFEGDTGPPLERTKKALGWLLSPAAQGLGEKLLRDAYSKTGKPLTIYITREAPSHYANRKGQHMVVMNPLDADQRQIKLADGTWHHFSLESSLAHELTHAGQDIADPKKYAALYAKLEQTIGNIPDGEEKIARIKHHETYATNTSYFIIAQREIERLVTQEIALGNELLAAQQQQPAYQEYIAKYENPAIANQAKVQRLRGEPVRVDYIGYRPVPGYEEQNEMRKYDKLLAGKVGIAPFPPAKGKDWKTYVQGGNRFTFQIPSHPLLAVHQDGGRN